MAKKESKVMLCPSCGKDISEALTTNIENKIRHQFETEMKETEKEYKQKIKDLQDEANQKLEDALKEERQKIEKEAKRKAEESISKDFKDLQEQVKEKSERLKEAEKQELQLRKEKRELADATEAFELEMQRKLDEEKKKIFEEAFGKAEEKHELKYKDILKINDDLKKQIQDLQKKSEQGSQKLQGEVLEEELENLLAEAFPTDEIVPISSGVLGADILQKVYSRSGKGHGSILFESKRAKNWSNGWIPKLKGDMMEAKADIGVIVTTTLPEGIINFGCIDKVIVVHYKMILPVATLLRNQLSEISLTKNLNVGKNEKMEALFNYLTSAEFRQRFESVGSAFKEMKEDLEREKRAIKKQWAKRDQQIEQVFTGLGTMYGGMQAVIGSSLPNIKLLEFDSSSDDLKQNEAVMPVNGRKKRKKATIMV
ncbi:MAG: DUF2130 domain-containing protein [Nanoarchaeota archaeon]|nr:DUF2130 domain-containing protein [Nanoarchaeota archaeon]